MIHGSPPLRAIYGLQSKRDLRTSTGTVRPPLSRNVDQSLADQTKLSPNPDPFLLGRRFGDKLLDREMLPVSYLHSLR